ncbi:MAG: hypothetical protein AB8F34_09015 [Akkermansiaceae bacterium]
MKYLIVLVALLTPGLVSASGKKTPPASITFHIEGTAAEAPKFARKVRTLVGDKYFRKIPEVSTKDIDSFSPFPADDKSTYGLVFKVNKQSAARLQAVTSNNRGKLLLALLNGQPMGVVRIDKPVSDGMLVIWSGVTLPEIRKYDILAPRIGENKAQWKTRAKEAKKKQRKKK